MNIALSLDVDNTALIQVSDGEMSGYHVFENDVAIIDESLTPKGGDIVYCSIDGELQFRKLVVEGKKKVLYSSNKKTLPVINFGFVESKGVVTHTITSHIPFNFYANGTGDGSVDLNKLLVKNKASTFLGRINGNSMKDSNILNNDIAIIDKAIPYINGYKALCRIEDKFTVKFLEWDTKDKNTLWLMPANEEFKPIRETGNNDVEVWGVIAYTITSHCNFTIHV